MQIDKLSPDCQAMFSKAGKDEQISVLMRTKSKTIGEEEAKQAFDALKMEQLAPSRRQLLEKIKERYGSGKEFTSNLKDCRHSEHSRLIKHASSSCSLWIADAVAVRGTKKELSDLTGHEDVLSVDINRTFKSPETLQTPAEVAPVVVDSCAWGLRSINAPKVWGGFGRGDGILVGHLDTGFDDTHPALQGKLAQFAEFDIVGNIVPGAPVHDSRTHGTHTAGTICGSTIDGTCIGVAPGARLLSGLVLPGGSGSFAQIVSGMQWTIDQGAHLMNMSLGGNGYNTIWNLPVLLSTLSGVLVVASIGNSGQGNTGGPGNDFFALGVGATAFSDIPGGFSGGKTLVGVWHDYISPFLGPLTYTKPDISAPGVHILSSVPGDGMQAWNGTSMAAPHVAGAAALVLSAAPALRGNTFGLRNVLLGTVEDYGEAGKDQRFGFGRLDALTAAQVAVAAFI